MTPELLALSKDLSHAEFRVWIVLVWSGNGTGQARPSLAELSDTVHINRRQLLRTLNSLETKGFISRERSLGRRTAYILRTSDTQTTRVVQTTGLHDTGVTQTTPPVSSEPPVPSLISRSSYSEKNKSNTEPPSVPPKGGTGRVRSKFPILKTAEAVCKALETVDLAKAKADWEPHGVEVQDVWLAFQQVCLSGTPTKPFLNPYGYRDLPRAFNDWCRRRKEQGPRGSPKKPRKSDMEVFNEIMKGKEPDNDRG